MRIGVNALFLQRPLTGMGQHLFHLLKGLDEYDDQNTYVLLSPRFRHSSVGRFPQLSDRFQNIEVVRHHPRVNSYGFRNLIDILWFLRLTQVLQDFETSWLHHDFRRPVYNKLQRAYHPPRHRLSNT